MKNKLKHSYDKYGKNSNITIYHKMKNLIDIIKEGKNSNIKVKASDNIDSVKGVVSAAVDWGGNLGVIIGKPFKTDGGDYAAAEKLVKNLGIKIGNGFDAWENSGEEAEYAVYYVMNNQNEANCYAFGEDGVCTLLDD